MTTIAEDVEFHSPAASANIDFVSPDKKVVIDNDQTMKDNDAIVQLNDTTANFDNNEGQAAKSSREEAWPKRGILP